MCGFDILLALGFSQMASSNVQRKCEKWIVATWLPEKYGQRFATRPLPMQDRGHFAFDAVSEDEFIVGNISTATSTTHRGSVAPGKKSKIRADCLMLSLVKARTKLLILTEQDTAEFFHNEQQQGRLPLDIEIVRVQLPSNLQAELLEARAMASKEVQRSA